MKKYFILFFIIGATTLFASATIFGDGTTQSLSFNSEPDGAIVKIDGVKKCTTPCSIELKRNEFNTVEFIKDGYEDGIINLKGNNFTLAFWANVLFIYSTTTDLANGAAYEYDKNNYFIELKKSELKWNYNNHYLDKELLSDIRSFIMIEYHTLKLELNNNYIINNTTHALVSLLSDYYKIDNLIFMEFVKTHIEKTTNPVELLRKIEKGINWNI